MASLGFREQILLGPNTRREVLITLSYSSTSKRVANLSLLGDPLLAQRKEGREKEGMNGRKSII